MHTFEQAGWKPTGWKTKSTGIDQNLQDTGNNSTKQQKKKSECLC